MLYKAIEMLRYLQASLCEDQTENEIAEFGFRHLQLFQKTAIWKKPLFNISGIDFDYMLKKMTFNFLLTLALSDMKKYHPQSTAQNTSVTNGEIFFLGNSKSFEKKGGCILLWFLRGKNKRTHSYMYFDTLTFPPPIFWICLGYKYN